MTTRTTAFSRIDLVALLGALGLLILLVSPALGGSRGEADRAVCLNNLRRVGQAIIGWGLNRQGNVPWRTSTVDGGIAGSGNAWYNFAYLSNYLVTPTILACPAEERLAKVATHWANSPDGGFTHVTYRGNALSYFVGLDAFPLAPSSLLSGDRNLRVDGINASCSAGVNNAAAIYRGSQTVAWTNEIHRFQGNILFADGGVALLTTDQLRAEFQRGDDNGSTHLFMPR